jgi:hypothetical protein
MKVRSAAVLVAVLLTMSALTAAIARADAPTAPVTPAVATPAGPALAAAPCGANSSSLFPIESVAPVSKATNACGSCSESLCRGVTYNSACGSPRYPATCVAALGNVCSLGVPQCQCWSVGAPFP